MFFAYFCVFVLFAPAVGFSLTSQRSGLQDEQVRESFGRFHEREMAQQKEDLETMRRILMKNNIPEKYLVRPNNLAHFFFN